MTNNACQINYCRKGADDCKSGNQQERARTARQKIKKPRRIVPLSKSCPGIKHNLAKNTVRAELRPLKNKGITPSAKTASGSIKHNLAKEDKIKQLMAKKTPRNYRGFLNKFHIWFENHSVAASFSFLLLPSGACDEHQIRRHAGF